MQGIHLDISGIENFVTKEEIMAMEQEVFKAHDMLQNKNGEGKEMLGWMDLPSNRNEEEIQRIKECAKRIQKQSDVLVVVGIGGSYLGAKAVIDLFANTFDNMLSYSQRKYPEIIFAGNSLSGKYLRNLIEYLEDKDFSVNVISKSGKTLEPAVAFRTLRLVLEKKYGI